MVNIRRKVISFIQIILLIVLVFSLVKIYSYQMNLKQTEQIEEESREMIEIVREDIKKASKTDEVNLEEVEESVRGISLGFIEKLKQSYPEAVGYIEIEGTRISYPIVQHKDNDYYLNHSPDMEVSANGSIFLDYRNSPRLDDDNNIIYGHYIRSGKLFHDLYKFKEQEFYNRVDKIELQTVDGPKTYKVFAAYDTDPSFQYRYINYLDKDEKRQFIDTIKSKSVIDSGNVDGLYDDAKILTLSSCSNRGATRLVVHGVEVKD